MSNNFNSQSLAPDNIGEGAVAGPQKESFGVEEIAAFLKTSPTSDSKAEWSFDALNQAIITIFHLICTEDERAIKEFHEGCLRVVCPESRKSVLKLLNALIDGHKELMFILNEEYNTGEDCSQSDTVVGPTTAFLKTSPISETKSETEIITSLYDFIDSLDERSIKEYQEYLLSQQSGIIRLNFFNYCLETYRDVEVILNEEDNANEDITGSNAFASQKKESSDLKETTAFQKTSPKSESMSALSDFPDTSVEKAMKEYLLSKESGIYHLYFFNLCLESYRDLEVISNEEDNAGEFDAQSNTDDGLKKESSGVEETIQKTSSTSESKAEKSVDSVQAFKTIFEFVNSGDKRLMKEYQEHVLRKEKIGLFACFLKALKEMI